MADFAAEVRRLMTERGMSLRGLAKASNYDPSYLSKVLAGHKPSSPYLAARLDDALGAGGTIRDAAQEPPPRRTGKASTPQRKPSGAVEALQVAMAGDPAGPDIGADGLAELVLHYAHALAVAPSAAVYGELLSARSFAGTLLGRSSPRQRPDLTVTAGWLSSLLAISAADLGDHAAAVIWCADTERRGQHASYPELLGWAALTRSLIAWYQGDPLASAAAARLGQADGQPASVAHAKLAAQEMRCRAMLGDAAGMAEARRRAAAAMAQLGPPAPAASVYSVPRAEDPPYTATSLLPAGRYAEAAQMTRRIIGIRLSELAGIRYHPGDPARSDLDLQVREVRIAGKAGKPRTVRIGHQAARSLDRYLRGRARHPQAWRPQLWLGVNSRGPLTPAGIYQIVARRGRQCGVNVYPHRFRHHFSHTWLDRGGAERDLMELNGWTSPQMLTRYGASASARRSYDRIMDDST